MVLLVTDRVISLTESSPAESSSSWVISSPQSLSGSWVKVTSCSSGGDTAPDL